MKLGVCIANSTKPKSLVGWLKFDGIYSGFVGWIHMRSLKWKWEDMIKEYVGI